MFSVVIPLYNKAETITDAIQHVLNQTFQDFEIIVVDDGSTDESADKVKAISDSRIRLFSQANAGVSAARNAGIAEAKGEYVAFLDADDEWEINYLDELHSLTIKYPECDVFASDYVFRRGNTVTNTILNSIDISKGNDGVLNNYFRIAAHSNPPLWTSAVMVRKSAIESVGGFPVGIRSGEDLLTWARLACRFNIAYIRKPLAIFQIEGYDVKEKPKRVPAENDIVGLELKALEREFHTPGIRAYRSMWHKMRASVYMRLRMRGKSIKESAKALRLDPLNYKLYAFIVLNLLPSKLQPF